MGLEGGGTKLSALGLQWLVQEVFRVINVTCGRLSVDTEGLGLELGRMSRYSEGVTWVLSDLPHSKGFLKGAAGGRKCLRKGDTRTRSLGLPGGEERCSFLFRFLREYIYFFQVIIFREAHKHTPGGFCSRLCRKNS